MAPSEAAHRLAAIMACDIVGYSRLMSADETDTLARLNHHLRATIFPRVRGNGGRVVNVAGDAVLAEFPSATAAVSAAIAIQCQMESGEKSRPAARQMRLRIGINLGDVLVEDDRIYGDGVNMAARLEAMAPAGGITVARSVHREVVNRLGLQARPRGEQSVKNLPPVTAFDILIEPQGPTRPWRARESVRALRPGAVALVLVAIVATSRDTPRAVGPDESASADSSHASGGRPPGSVADRPIIAVLPFDDLSGDPRWARLTAGITADITTDLARQPDLLVIARESAAAFKSKTPDVRDIARALGARYVLAGSLQAADSRVRVAAQLIDTSSGTYLWARRFEASEGDLFTIQDSVVSQVAVAIGGFHGEILRAERRRSSGKPSLSLGIYEQYLRGRDLEEQMSEAAIGQSIGLLEHVVAEAPDFAPAWLILSYAYDEAADFAFSGSPETAREKRRQAVLKAAALDPDDAPTQIELGDIYVAEGNKAGGIACYERAASLAGGDPDVLALLAKYVVGTLGRPAEAKEMMATAFRLNPVAPPVYHYNMLRVSFLTGDYEAAVASAALSPSTPVTLTFLALSLAELGRQGDARGVAQKLRLDNPGFDPLEIRGWPYMLHPTARARFDRALADAGLSPVAYAPQPPE
jgi:TolB-like protein/class 3 adenylate cyclase